MKNKFLFIKKIDHVFDMTTDVGFWQFAKGVSPDTSYGYSIDDQARALILVLFLYQRKKERKFLNLAKIYLNFIKKAQRNDGYFHNFADAKGKFIDNIGSQDSFGRATWALGVCHNHGTKTLIEKSLKIFKKAKIRIKNLRYIRSKAYAMLGLLHFYKNSEDSEIEIILHSFASYMIKKYRKTSTGNWRFFENKLIYANAILPYSLLCYSEAFSSEETAEIGLESFNFLDKTCRSKGLPAPIGNKGWYEKGSKKIFFDPQPIDVCDMILAAGKAYDLTGDKKYFKIASEWFAWFFGRNIHNSVFYDLETGGCHDGIRSHKLNPDEGAESTICFHLANLEIERLYKK